MTSISVDVAGIPVLFTDARTSVCSASAYSRWLPAGAGERILALAGGQEEGKERDWPGEAKIAGRAIPGGPATTDGASEQPAGEMFVAEITEVVITGLNAEATKLVVESWTPERGLRRVERD